MNENENENKNNNKTVILKELEILQEIISRQEDIRLRLRNWYITLVTALTITYISKELNIGRTDYLLSSLVISILFLWLEVIHRVAENRAMNRSEDVEAALREEKTYQGPMIGKSLVKNNSPSEQLQALNNIRIYSTYVFVIIVVAIIYIMSFN